MWYVLRKNGELVAEFLTLKQLEALEDMPLSLGHMEKQGAEDVISKRRENSGHSVMYYENYARMLADWQDEVPIVQHAQLKG